MDLGNNVDQMNFKVKISTELVVAPPSSVAQVVSELFTLVLVMAEKMAVVSKGEDFDEGVDDEIFFPAESKGKKTSS
jgi:hypothetical protein